MAEVNAVTRLAQTAAASAQFGANKQDTVAKMGSLLDRMQVLQQVDGSCAVDAPSTQPVARHISNCGIAG